MDDWGTPDYIFEPLDKEFRFDLDVCATRDNAKCLRYFSKKEDGLKQDWQGVVWMNPPYGRGIGEWVKKAYEESRNGNTIVGLLPSSTSTEWFHKYVLRKAEIRFIRQRVKFVGKSKRNRPTFDSIIVVWS